MQRPTRFPAASPVLVGLGLVFGVAFVLTSPYRDAPLWWVWAPLAVALTTAAGAVFGYGLDRWAELADLLHQPTVRVRSAAPRVTPSRSSRCWGSSGQRSSQGRRGPVGGR